MRILFANATRKWGGEKTWALDTATTLARRGHHCVMVGRKGNKWVEAGSRAGLASYGLWFGFDFNPSPIWHIARIARRHAVDCIVVNISKDLRTGCLAGALTGIPVVRHVGLWWDVRDRWIDRALYRRFYRGMVVVGHRMKEELLEQIPWVEAERIEVIHIGKDPDRFCTRRSQRLKKELGLPDEAILVGVTSQLHPLKGHEVLLEAFAEVAAEREQVYLALVGEGPHRGVLEDKVRKLGLEQRVCFLGFQHDIPEVLTNFDVYALPSFSEGFPNTLVEAMASGLPCISTRISCVPEILLDGQNGLLVESGDVASMASALGRLCDDGELRERFGGAARRRVEEDFRLEDKAEQFVTYLETIVDGSAEG